MIFLSMLCAPVVMAAAASIEGHCGPSAAGWLAALPVSFAVAVAAVMLDSGEETATAMALSAATHVPAQMFFAVAFATVLTRRGLLVGAAVGAGAYLAGAIALAPVPAVGAIALAIPLLALAPLLISANRPRHGSPKRWSTTAMTCAAASIIVGAAVLTSRLAGPTAAGAIAAFPTMITALTVAVVRGDGPLAGANVLLGLTHSLPRYLTFCLVVALAAPTAGMPAIALALIGCVVAGRVTWRTVPLAPRAVATT